MRRPTAAQLAAQSSLAVGRIMIGVGHGIEGMGSPLLPLALGAGASVEHFGCRLIRAAYHKHGASGASVALTQLTVMLEDLKQSFIEATRTSPEAAASSKN